MKERLFFKTINCDGKRILWKFNSFDEIKSNWASDDCTLPSLDDELVLAYVEVYSGFTKSWYTIDINGNTFNDLVIAIGLDD